MARVATAADAPTLLAIWTAFLPSMNAAYGALNVNQARIAADFVASMAAGDEYWLTNDLRGYVMGRPTQEGYQLVEAPLRNVTTTTDFNNLARELITAWRDAGRARLLRQAYGIAPQAIATRVRNYLTSRALRRTAATMFQTVPAYRWEFDLDTLLVP